MSRVNTHYKRTTMFLCRVEYVMKRQESPESSDGSSAVVCVVPPVRRSPAEPPLLVAQSGRPAEPGAADGAVRRAAAHLTPAGDQDQQPPALPQAPASHLVDGIMSNQHASLTAGHGAYPVHAAYGENL
ncbi:hypothetical protein FJT64_022664 [Amphibalanus amphitrite]|uniref:Uncharacterized protein n=1 Tax=Amphibalanus amphitrite TaxID=1232801 RepID=A0A6A4WU58_AMPAM|nr:hypothetical protein FJT64_022664 [Amphibalanus amphitrite]